MIENMDAGDYIIRVVNFNGTDMGHDKIWNMKSYASSSRVALTERSTY